MIDDKMLIPELSVPWEESLKLVGEDGSEFLSDFCIMMDRTGRWHCIGIGGQGHIQDSFFHAVSDGFPEHMTYINRVGSGRPEMEWMWAPFAISAGEEGTLIYYCHRESGHYQMRVLRSTDQTMDRFVPLQHPLLPEGNIAFLQKDDRDPCIFFDESIDKYIMYYSAAEGEEEYSKIFARTSKDLIVWSDEIVIMGIPDGFVAAESPFVFRKNGGYYLFVSGFDYGRVAVYYSQTPFDFGDADSDMITEINGHAPEIVTVKGKDYIACAAISTKQAGNPGEHNLSGVYVQELRFV